MKRKITGFTLIELLVVLVIAGILLAIGAPAVRGVFTSNRMATHLNQLSTALLYARSEAIKRVVPVAVGASGTWAGGWNVWLDNITEDGILDTNPPETIIRTGGATSTGITLVGSTTAIVFQPDGTIKVPGVGATTIVPTAAITLTLCYSGQKPRILTISTTGRPQLGTGTTVCP